MPINTTIGYNKTLKWSYNVSQYVREYAQCTDYSLCTFIGYSTQHKEITFIKASPFAGRGGDK